ncbi:MAG: GNAT family N-acetyltransferase [Chlamydiales bacterium]
MNDLQIQKIGPEDSLWNIFLKLSADYFLEIWPESFTGKSLPSLMHDYDQQLRKRIAEGGRYLFLLKREEDILGFANVYLNSSLIPNTKQRVLTLNIAEFAILPAWRRKGLGTYFLQSLVDFGKKKGAERVSAEVDLKNEAALKFWGLYFSDYVRVDSRIVFWKILIL